mmetsp:Transcript_6118/g.7561  ORF Transcript_6118/g.7561 Transcript_6118/m.7561 type:complete len:655 (+) Transcript_6118:166-2130(+)
MAMPTFSKSSIVVLLTLLNLSPLIASKPQHERTPAKLLHFPIIPHSEVVRRNRVRNRNRDRNLGEEEALLTEERNPEPYYHNSTLEVGGLYQGYGTHYVDLWVGSPPQRQTVIVDTGSGVTAFPCTGCNDCGMDYHVDSFFDYMHSSTFVKFDSCGQCDGARCSGPDGDEYCHLSVSYQEGSMWNAFQGQDVTYVGGLHDQSLSEEDGLVGGNKEGGDKIHGLIHGEDPLSAADFSFNMVFGCQTKITGLFKTQLADGIMGMCLKSSSIFNQMYRQQVTSSPSFSLCFARADEAEKDGTIAGALTMGGTDTRLHEKPMIYAHGFPTKGVMHGVKIRKIYLMKAGTYEASDVSADNTKEINIQSSSLNGGSVIVDSGTTDTYMTRNLKAPFQKVFKEVAGFDYAESGMKLSEEQVYQLPTIVLQLEGHEDDNKAMSEGTPGLARAVDQQHPNDILIVIPPAHYIEYDTDHKKYVGRFSMTESSGSVLGANTIRGHDVYFDITESNRIGFAPSDCDYYGLVNSDDDEDDSEEVSVNYKEKGDNEAFDDDDDDNFDLDDEVGGGDDYGNFNSGEVGSDDDYYENESSNKFSLGKIGTKAKESSASSVFVALALVGVVGLALVALAKRLRRNNTYAPAVADLNDLHLDTEVEKLPAIA